MKHIMMFLAVFTFNIISNTSAQDTLFSERLDYAVGPTPRFVFVADLNGDGYNDLVTANANETGQVPENQVSVLINNGNWTFQAANNYYLGLWTNPMSVFASDLDADGDKDLAVANGRGSYNVSILPNNGDGTFSVIGRNYAVPGPNYIFVADLDGDDDNDLVTANGGAFEQNDISVLFNNVDGTFQAAVNYNIGQWDAMPQAAFASDLDGDGDKDLAVVNVQTNNISILPNDGNGTFQIINRNYAAGNNPKSIFASDLDGDGDKDLAVADLGLDIILIFLNNGNATFQAPVSYAAGYDPYFVVASDLDGDGDKDLAVAKWGANNVSILLNNGNGAFVLSSVTYTVGDGPSSIFAVDLDEDGDKDLVTSNYYSYSISILRNQSNRQPGAISGTITNIYGSIPLRDARVKVFVIDDYGEYFEFGSDTTGANGQYFVAGLYPGRYSLRVSRNGYYSKTRDVIVPEGGVDTVNFSLKLAGFIHDSVYVAGDNPRSVCASDLDGDGDKDLAVANATSNNVSILINSGNGTFQAAVNYNAGDGPVSIFNADLDGDGDEDLAVANNNSNNISLLFNNGYGIFQPPVNYGVGYVPTSIFASDLDGDGDKDLAITNQNSNNVSILINNGNGTYQSAVNFAVGTYPVSAYASDLDGDGDKDLAVANGVSNNVSILKNDGNGTFQLAVNYQVGTVPMSIFASDFDDDGDIDLAASNASSDNVSILENNGNGTFLPAVNYPAGEVPVCVFASDLDGDGFKDLAVTTVGNMVTDSVTILLNNGNSTFQMPVNYAVGLGPSSVFAADLDDDGDNDLAVTNSSSDDISILLNQSFITGVENSPELHLPNNFNISQNFPNPFNPSTKIKYSIPQPSNVIIKVFDILGREIETLVNEEKPAGAYIVKFNASRLSSGIYFYQLQAGGFMETKKMILMR